MHNKGDDKHDRSSIYEVDRVATQNRVSIAPSKLLVTVRVPDAKISMRTSPPLPLLLLTTTTTPSTSIQSNFVHHGRLIFLRVT